MIKSVYTKSDGLAYEPRESQRLNELKQGREQKIDLKVKSKTKTHTHTGPVNKCPHFILSYDSNKMVYRTCKKLINTNLVK